MSRPFIPALFLTRPDSLSTVTRILGIDPGLRMTGFGVIEMQGQKLRYIASGCIKSDGNQRLPERLHTLYAGIIEIIATYKPDIAAVEQVFSNVNPQSTLLLGQARGAALAALVSGDLPVSGTTTAEAGQAVTVQLVAANGTVIGTYYTIVQPGGSLALNIPQAALPADGSYTLKADVSNFAGTPAVQQTSPVIFDTTAPVISVTSVAGDAVSATGSGTFDGSERGFNLTDYTLSSTVPTPPIISGTTDAQAGQVVNVLFNNVS